MQNVVEYIHTQGYVEEIARNLKVTQTYYDDFVQEMYLVLLTYNQDTISRLVKENKIKYWIIAVAIKTWRGTGPFHRKYRKYDKKKLYIEKFEELPITD